MEILKKDINSIIEDKSIEWSRLDGSCVFVTGATGLIGSLLVKTLLARGRNIRIIALARSIAKAETMLGTSPNLALVTGDIRDDKWVDEALKVCDGACEYVIHCASVTVGRMMVEQPEETVAISTEGTRNVLSFASEVKARNPELPRGIVYLSSMEMYGLTQPEQNPVTEDKLGTLDLSNPRSSYPLSKRLCEEMCREAASDRGLPVRIARLAQTTGAGIPLGDNRVAMQFARAAKNGDDIVLHTAGRSISNYVYTADAIRGILMLAVSGADGEAYNICNDSESRSIAEIAQLVAGRVAAAEGHTINVTFDIPDTNVHGYAPDSVMRLNSDKLRRLGWEPHTDMETAYRNLVTYLKENEQ